MVSWVVAAAAVMSIIAALGAAGASLALGRQKGLVKGLSARATLLEQDVVDRDRRIDFLEEESERKGLAIAELHEQVLELRDLRTVVTGEANYHALSAQLENNLKVMQPMLERLLQGQQDIMALCGGRRSGNGKGTQ